jgi:hypothetical protein
MDGPDSTKCGARKKNGERCGNGAGKGTPYSTGPCHLHGGMLPGPRKAAARRELAAVAHSLGVAIDVEPHDLLLTVVRQAAGALQWATDRLGSDPSDETIRVHGEAMDRAARISKTALDAGIAERRLRVAQRTGALIAAAFERSLQDAGIDPDDRMRLVARFEGHLLALEQGAEEDDVIEGSASG